MGGVWPMDEKRISSAAKKVRGSITEALGKLTGDNATEKKGAAQKKEAEVELAATKTKRAALRKKSARQTDRMFNPAEGV
jgi:uncharacterized protein YjbJ (UPF0337 family)